MTYIKLIEDEERFWGNTVSLGSEIVFTLL
jgi:hypothetical protein